jgi:N-formylglutamate amidohydrolase
MGQAPSDASFCRISRGSGPLVATAIHDGHGLRREAAESILLSDDDRLREEDPQTGRWASLAPTRLVALRSRFEVDLNRPRDKAVYRLPEDAWGLKTWADEPSEEFVQDSLILYDGFYAELEGVYRALLERHAKLVVFDLHSYNHRRDGPAGPPADPAGNPDVNVGTGTLPDRGRWASLIDRFIADLSGFAFPGQPLDVRENVRFRGGNVGRWSHETFPDEVCVLSVEVKKFFMDEWTGQVDAAKHEAVGRALAATVPGVLEELSRLGARS